MAGELTALGFPGLPCCLEVAFARPADMQPGRRPGLISGGASPGPAAGAAPGGCAFPVSGAARHAALEGGRASAYASDGEVVRDASSLAHGQKMERKLQKSQTKSQEKIKRGAVSVN